MNRRVLIFILIAAGAILVAVYYSFFFKSEKSTSIGDSAKPSQATAPVQTFQGRRVLNTPPKMTQTKLPDIKVSNQVSRDWETNLVSTLRYQGGDRLKDVKIEKVESIIWTTNGHYINAESVRITLTDQNGALTKFRAIVDSESGQIIEVWDRPMIENVKRLPE